MELQHRHKNRELEPKPLCLIPARGGSKRFPRKNVALLGGRTLIGHVISTANECGIFEVRFIGYEPSQIVELVSQSGIERGVRDDEDEDHDIGFVHIARGEFRAWRRGRVARRQRR